MRNTTTAATNRYPAKCSWFCSARKLPATTQPTVT